MRPHREVALPINYGTTKNQANEKVCFRVAASQLKINMADQRSSGQKDHWEVTIPTDI